jgi:hypothetical protein
MRVLLTAFALVFAAEALPAADLGSPVPMPDRAGRNVGKEEEQKMLETRSAERTPRSELSTCPCGDNCDCSAGQCPACPARGNATPVMTTYRQVWIRGAGWVWMPDAPASTYGGCASGTCSLSGRSR